MATLCSLGALVLTGATIDGAAAQEAPVRDLFTDGQPVARNVDRTNEANSLDDPARAEVVPLAEWSYDALESGWTAASVISAPVIGPNGDEIGEARNILLDARGVAVALIAEIGGFWDFRKAHLALPMDDIAIEPDGIHVPLTEESAENYGLFRDDFFSQIDIGTIERVDDDVQTGPRLWKASDLIDDYIVIESGEPVGLITDLVFNDGDELESVIVSAANPDLIELGEYEYPWYDVGWEPKLDYYALPYDREEFAGLAMLVRGDD